MKEKELFFTKENYDALYDAEIHFISACRGGYIKNTPRWLTDQVADIWEKATGEKVRRNWNCSSCVLNLYYLIGKKYLNDKKIYEDMEKETLEKETLEKETKEFTEHVEEFIESQVEQPIEPKVYSIPDSVVDSLLDVIADELQENGDIETSKEVRKNKSRKHKKDEK